MNTVVAAADTIVAIATAQGIGGVGIVRVSGPAAPTIAHAIFRRNPGRTFSGRLLHNQMAHGYVMDGTGNVIDEVLCCFMAGPRSYTAEDVVEFHGHGGPVGLRLIAQRCVEAGARPAEPGEFTLRAFLNGRIDLAQAEAVADVISARSSLALRVAQGQLQGELSDRIAGVRAPVLHVLAHCQAVVDFAEEGVPDLGESDALSQMRDAFEQVLALLKEARAGRAIREGMRAAIIGRPNVGKSSLLNALVRSDRAIVTPFPGTTRDTLEELMVLDGVPVSFVDTAGMHGTSDDIERLGIERARRVLAQADLAILVLDRSEALSAVDVQLLAAFGVCASPPPSQFSLDSIPYTLSVGGPDEIVTPSTAIIVINKCDLPAAWAWSTLPGECQHPIVETSMLAGTGIERLETAVRDTLLGNDASSSNEPVLSNLRHIEQLASARDHLAAAIESVESGLAPDFTAIDLRCALDALCRITGESASDALLGEIFSRYCIGK